MINQHARTLKLTRIEVCDLLIALHCCEEAGQKWKALADKITSQLDAQDNRDNSQFDIDYI